MVLKNEIYLGKKILQISKKKVNINITSTCMFVEHFIPDSTKNGDL